MAHGLLSSGPVVSSATGIEATEEQLAIQSATELTVLVEANAGAAKTTTLALRIAYACSRGVAPSRILALTYTQPACVALRNALNKVGVSFDGARKVQIATFESFSSAVLARVEGGAVIRYQSAEQLKESVQQAVARVWDAEDKWRDALEFPGTGDPLVEILIHEFLQLKGTMLLDIEAPERRITPAAADDLGKNYAVLRSLREYERLRRGGKDQPRFRAPGDATYDLARQCLSGESDGDSAHWPCGLLQVLVDEMHDVNRAMFEVLRQLLRLNRAAAFCGVGDRDQVIHKVAGADRRFMGEWFDLEGRRPATYALSASFRFGHSLARGAGMLTGKSYASKAEHETHVAVLGHTKPGQCEAAIVQSIQLWIKSRGRKKSLPFAVLLRHDHQSIELENQLLSAGIDYAMDGYTGYLQRPEVLLIRGLLAVASKDFSSIDHKPTRRAIVEALVFFCGVKIDVGGSDNDDQQGQLALAVRAVEEHPDLLSPFLENQVLRNAEPEVARRLRAAIDASRGGTGTQILERVAQALDASFLAKRVLVEASRVAQVALNIQGLIASAAPYGSAADFFKALNDFEVRFRGQKKAGQPVIVSSIEAAKGLEFDHVHVPHVDRGEFPFSSADADEERNLFYVAVTRARTSLTIHCDAAKPSRFVSAFRAGASNSV